MKILVTGTTGFVGSHLIEKLKETKHQIICLERYVSGRQIEGENTHIVHADLNDHVAIKGILQQEQPEVVIHLAALSPVAYSYQHWNEVIETNFTATANLAELCRTQIRNFGLFL